MAEKIKWGILGAGKIARTFAAAVLQSQTGELLAIGSREKPKAEQFASEFSIPRSYGSYDELVADPEVDAIYISLPNHLHAEWTIRCAESGKHILCEKPLATNLAESMLAVEAARANNVFLMEAFMYRCHPQTARLAELVRSGAIGKVRLIEVSFSYRLGGKFENIRLQNDAAGGGIMDVGCYTVSMARLIAGAALGQDVAEPVEIKGLAHLGKTSRVDEWASAVLRFRDDILATVTCGNEIAKDAIVQVWGTEGSITVPNPWFPGREGQTEKIILKRSGQPVEEIAVPTETPLYALEADAVAAYLQDGQAPAPHMTWADSLGNMETLDGWRKQVGLTFDNEKGEALKKPIAAHYLKPQPENRMVYGKVDGLDKEVSRVVLGSMVMDHTRLPFSFSLLDYFVENGGNCIDTAYVYGGGSCEKAVGEWFTHRQNRDQIVLIGKGGCTTSVTPDMITRELMQSLDRLQTDHLDIYFMHRDNVNIPVGEFVECLNEHKRAGRIKVFGGSNWTTARLAEANAYAAAHGLTGFAASSPNFSLAQWNEAPWEDCLAASDPASRAWYEKSGVALFAWSSQASGLFSGRFKADDPNADPFVKRVWFNDANFQRLARAQELAARKGVEATQVALAYVLAQPLNIYALIGPRTVEETRTSLMALDVKLTQDELRWLSEG